MRQTSCCVTGPLLLHLLAEAGLSGTTQLKSARVGGGMFVFCASTSSKAAQREAPQSFRRAGP